MKKTRILTSLFSLIISFSLHSQASNEWNRKDSKGLKTGAWKGFYPEGELRYVGQFEKDVPVDTFLYYYPDGKLKSVLIHHPEIANKVFATHFYSTGDTLAKGSYLDQKKEGLWVNYGDQSVPLQKGTYKEGKKNGRWTIFYPNGVVSEIIHYEMEIENGPHKTYFENGQVRKDAYFLNGAMHGQVTFYTEDGKKEQEGEYIEDLRDGDWIIFDEEEQVEKIYKYESGRLMNPDIQDSIDYDKSEFQDQRKDYLEFDDLRGKIKYD